MASTVSARLLASLAMGQFQSVMACCSGRQPEICTVFALEKAAPASLWFPRLLWPEAFWRHETVLNWYCSVGKEPHADSQIWDSTEIYCMGSESLCFVSGCWGQLCGPEGNRGHSSGKPVDIRCSDFETKGQQQV